MEFSVETTSQSDCGVIRVSGHGHVNVQADIVRFTVGVEERGDDVQLMRATVASKMTAVIKEMHRAGITDRDITTDRLLLSRVWERKSSRYNDYDGYYVWVVRNTAAVQTRNLNVVGSILDGAIEAGANVMTNFEFGIEDSTVARRTALEEAMKDARSKAETIAKMEELTLSGVQFVRDQAFSQEESSQYLSSLAEPCVPPATTPVISGEIEICADVTVSYIIR